MPLLKYWWCEEAFIFWTARPGCGSGGGGSSSGGGGGGFIFSGGACF
ncbi:hypothetical protein E2C01_075175 [Portunus trituberculatus]|uniref:Uncharacterized protein n=1 Tax=Portunus trituberculatus TaxID=210409 RepID=A0A5B7IA22_PORTR|nr:hypothetical protein [Portunus trituberculatus]